MNFTSIGDLAQSLQMRRQSSEIKNNLDIFAAELSTGQHADISRELNGNMRILAGIEASLSSLASYQRMASHAERHLQDTQTALNVIQDASDQAASNLLLTANVQDGALLDNAANDAKSKLATVIGALNTRSAGQALFSGIDTDVGAVISADDLISAVQADLAGLTSVADVQTALDAWFDTSGGGFETTGFTGSTTTLSPLQLNQTHSAELNTSALNTEIRQTLKGLIAAALTANDIPAGDTTTKQQMVTYASETLFSNASGLSALRGQVGLQQSVVEAASSANASQSSALQLGRNDLILADPFETATQLENTRNQLETLYAVTARLSQLKLADYLR